MREVFEALKQTLERHEKGALITIIRTFGSTPRKPGAKMLVLSSGQTVGTIGGSCVEGEIWREAREAIRTGRPKRILLRLNGETDEQNPGPGASAELFIEPIEGGIQHQQ